MLLPKRLYILIKQSNIVGVTPRNGSTLSLAQVGLAYTFGLSFFAEKRLPPMLGRCGIVNRMLYASGLSLARQVSSPTLGAAGGTRPP